MDKEVHEAFYGKYNEIFCKCTNSVYQTCPEVGGGGEVGGGTMLQWSYAKTIAMVHI